VRMRSRGNSGKEKVKVGDCKGSRMRIGSRGNIGKEKVEIKGGIRVEG
jgi:hypothetical protein